MGQLEQRVLAVADDLYAVPLSEFTRRRDEAATAVKGEDRDLAAALKALRKPTVAAWAVNLFVRRESAQVDQLLDLGVALREAQEALDGDELRALSRQRRQVTAGLATQVRGVAQQEGQRLTQTVVDQVESTFTAALLDEQVAVALRSGMLVQPVSATGFDVADLTGVVALPEALGFAAPPREAPEDEEPARPVLRLVPDPERRTKERRAAKADLAESERALARAERARRTSQRRVDDLEARLLRVRAEADELRRRLAELEAEAEEVEDELVEAEELRDESDEDLEAARAERDDAAATVERLSD